MKKIFAIILAVFMVFSMSATAFAGFTSAPKDEKVEPETVTVTVTLGDYTKPTDSPVLFEKYINKYAENEEEAEVVIEGRIFEVKFSIKNDTKEIIYVDEVLSGFNLSVTETATEKTVKRWVKAKDNGFGETDLSKIAINPKGDTIVTYKIYAITNKSVTIKAVYEEEAKNIEKNAIFTLIAKDETLTTTTTPTETTTVAPTEATTAAPVETTTKAPTENITVVTTTTTTAPTYVENTKETGGDDYYEAPEVDYEIPNTGSAPVIGAVAALGLAAGAIILLKKKKIDE